MTEHKADAAVVKTAEQGTIVKDILESEFLDNAPQLGPLLEHLWERYPARSPTLQLWDVIREHGRKKYTDEPSANQKEQSVRRACKDLRKKLQKYFAASTHCWTWLFDLPDAKKGKGYLLEITPQNNSSTMAFWRPHIEQQSIALIYAQPMFYLDTKTGCFLRFLDTNPHSMQEAMTELKNQHSTELASFYGETETAALRLRPALAYVGIGELMAMDELSEWFLPCRGVTLTKIATERQSSIYGLSPVLMGSYRTNKFIRSLLDAMEHKNIDWRYRVDKEHLFYVSIKAAEKNLKQELKRVFPVAPDEPDANGFTVAGGPMNIDARRNRPVILMRIPNLNGGLRPVTMIISDTTLAIGRLGSALADDNAIAELIRMLGVAENQLPEAFEALYCVLIKPGGTYDEAGELELLAARTIDMSVTVPPAALRAQSAP